MYWTLSAIEPCETTPDNTAHCGRFVLHRHHDAAGPHLDLRLELDGLLGGWRVGAGALAPGVWAEEKPPHAKHWLDQDGDAQRVDAGAYAWEQRDRDAWVLRLDGVAQTRRLTWRPVTGLPLDAVRALAGVLADTGAAPDRLPGLVRDGMAARNRAVARLCGLGRQLEPDGFDEPAWRALLEPLPLNAIERHLAAFERQADRARPPEPVSRPEPLDPPGPARRDQAWRQLRNAECAMRNAQ